MTTVQVARPDLRPRYRPASEPRLAGRPAVLLELQGGLALGLDLLQRHVPAHGFSTPGFEVVELGDAGRAMPGLVAALRHRLPSGIAFKYSGTGEAFSPHSRRGAQSSRGAHWFDGVVGSGGEILRDVAGRAPLGTVAIVAQELQPRDAFGDHVHAYVYDHLTVVELTGPATRSLTVVGRHGILQQSVVGGPAPDAAVVCRLAWRFDALRAAVSAELGTEVNLDVEGLLDGPGAVLLQLRPVPPDLPVDDEVALDIDRRLDQPSSGLRHLTHFTWGVWRAAGPLTIGDDAGAAVLLKTSSDVREVAPLQERLALGLPTLLLDPVGGFHLGHEPDQLPSEPDRRAAFTMVSVAGSPLAELRVGDTVSVLADGVRGLVDVA